MRIEYHVVKSLLKKYILTFVGSLILVFAWYFEKISTKKYEDIVVEKRRQLFEFEFLINHNTLNRGIENIITTLYKINPNTVSSKNRSALLVNAVLSSHFAYVNGKISYDPELTLEDFSTQSYVDKILGLQTKDDTLALKEELYRQNELLNFIDFSVQNEVKSQIENANRRLGYMNTLYLFFYIIGIILITIDKGKERINSENEELKSSLTKKRKN